MFFYKLFEKQKNATKCHKPINTNPTYYPTKDTENNLRFDIARFGQYFAKS